MCIRDSVGIVRGAGLLKAAARLADHALEARDDRGDGARVAVSYTHLRAHETVLDLVCRLLLEKKNKMEIDSNYGIRATTSKTHAHHSH